MRMGVPRGVRLGDGVHLCSAIVATLPAPMLSRLIPSAYQDYRDSLDATSYLGIVCPLLVLDRPLSGYLDAQHHG